MNTALSHIQTSSSSGAAATDIKGSFTNEPEMNLAEAIGRACARIAPLWPLKQFVAVNPFVGLSDRAFFETCLFARLVGQGNLLMPADFYAEQYRLGRILDADISEALALTGSVVKLEEFLQRWESVESLKSKTDKPAAAACLPSFASHLDELRGSNWATFIVEEISKWCAAYFDEGQSAWRMPWHGLPLYAAWRQAACFDRNPELAGIKNFRAHVATLPEEPGAAIAFMIKTMNLPEPRLADYFHRLLLSVSGWSSWAKYKVSQDEIKKRESSPLLDLLAIRLTFDYALLTALAPSPALVSDWRQRGVGTQLKSIGESPEFDVCHVMQWAYELAEQRSLLSKLSSPSSVATASKSDRKAVQAVFCIDVRSEVYRRALETASSDVETLGFAGFFGFPIEYIGFGHDHGPALCPVLIKPQYRIRESVLNASVIDLTKILEKRWLNKRFNRLWKSFKSSAVSCFSYVEITGLSFAPKLLTDSLGLTRPVVKPGAAGLNKTVISRMGPVIARQRSRLVAKGPVVETGIALGERIELAKNALHGMGLTGDFARLILLCGHGSSTVNNPYGAGLDCGACGGHSGEANARVAVAVLNDREVRAGLAAQGLSIPKDSWFVAGLHDTTTDIVKLYGLEQVPESHSRDVKQLQAWLDRASNTARGQRAPGLGLAQQVPSSLWKRIAARSHDWAQVRPEWGLAGNAAFIAAPRARTRHVDLGGRAFLHNYDYRHDSGGSVLALIMTAPMVVANWINLQYYASSVDNVRFGSGNKTLHNVVGTIGVLEGNGGDLRVGLPWQSVHDGKLLRHEPVRLSVIIEAPAAMIEQVLKEHPEVRQLVENHWLHLMRIDPQEEYFARYLGAGQWETISPLTQEQSHVH